jgi:hypothetical protein
VTTATIPAPPAPPSASAPRRPRSRTRRWFVRSLLAIVALLVIAVIVTQVVLSLTNVPQRIIVAQLQRTLGLRVEVGGVTTGWIGHTTLRDVTFALPLAEQPLATAPRVRVRHTWLPLILVTRSVSIDAIEIDRPTLRVVQLSSGDWNVQRAITQIALGARPAGADEAASRRRPTIPNVKITGGTLFVHDNSGREASIGPVDFAGEEDGPLVWQFRARALPNIDVEGELAPGSPWQHEVKFTLRDLEHVLAPWFARRQIPTHFAGHWVGRMPEGGGVTGRLTLADSQLGRLRPQGVAAVTIANGSLEVRPDRLLIDTGEDLVGQVRLVSGAILLSPNHVESQAIELELADGIARVSGQWRPRDDIATLEASWRDVRIPAAVTLNGQLRGELTCPLPGQPRVHATLNSAGTAVGAGTWESQVSLTGEGSSWGQLQLQLRGEHLAWNGARQLALDNLVASIITNGRRATIESVQLEGSDHLSGRGGYDFDQRSFWLWLRADELALSPKHVPLSFMINAWGDAGQVRLQQFFAQAPDLELSGDGYYVFHRPKPVDLQMYVRLVPGVMEPEGAAPMLSGKLHSAARVTGTASPLELALDGHFFADDLVVSDHAIGDVKMRMTGQVDGHDAHVNFSQFKVFEGDCQLSGVYPTDGRREAMKVEAAVQGMSLEKLAQSFNVRDVSGELNGAWKFQVPRDARRSSGAGTFNLTGVSAAQRFFAQSVEGTMRLADQRIMLDPVKLRQTEGTARAKAELSLQQPNVLDLALKAERWPVNLPRAGASALVDGTTDVRVDLRQKSANGSLAGALRLALGGTPMGQLQVRADLRGRGARIEQLQGAGLGGELNGQGTIDLDNVEAQDLDLSWKQLDGAQLAQFWPGFEGLDGIYTGELHLKSAHSEQRPLEPLRLDVNSHVQNGHWRTLQLGDGYWTAYLSRRRAVLEKSQFSVAGGTVNLWARTSTHGANPADKTVGANVIADWESVDLDQIVHALNPKSKPMPGRISGNAQVVGEPSHPQRMVGSGQVNIRDSDLANFGPVAFLYNTMHLDTDTVVPTGRGTASFRVEGANLIINQLRYFNRGTEIRANGVIDNFRKGPDAALDVGAVGSARPLSQIKVPGFASVDKIFALLQANLTTVHIGGTVRDPKTRIISFDEMNQTLRAIVFGDLKEEQAQQAQQQRQSR